MHDIHVTKIYRQSKYIVERRGSGDRNIRLLPSDLYFLLLSCCNSMLLKRLMSINDAGKEENFLAEVTFEAGILVPFLLGLDQHFELLIHLHNCTINVI